MKFQPVIKWSGSKRSLSEQIIQYFPKEIDTYYEPFVGGASVLFQLLHSDIKVNNYICSDINNTLVNIFSTIKCDPQSIIEQYKINHENLVRLNTIEQKQNYYNLIRSHYNSYYNIYDFMFLSRTCINGLIRFNSNGQFNSPIHHNRDGIKPDKFAKIVNQWSDKLNEKGVHFICKSYEQINPSENDYVFVDPPYFNTKGMYHGGIQLDEFWNFLRNLKCSYSLTFDGKRTDKDNTYDVPKDLYNKHIYLKSSISGFKKLHEQVSYVEESLYVKNNK